MLKLTKYEFRKNRTTLIIIAIGFLLLQGYFLGSIILEKENHSGMSASLLAMYSMVCFFAVFILAVANYSKELSSKSSYLIFMTPNSPLSIIFSKMLNILIIGTAIVVVFFVLGLFDIKLLMDTYPEIGSFTEMIKEIMKAIGIDVGGFLAKLFYFVVSFLISFFAVVTLVYFSITLSATLLQNNRFRGFLSFGLFVVFVLIVGYISDLIPVPYPDTQKYSEALINLIPGTLVELVVMIASIAGCSILLEKKVSL